MRCCHAWIASLVALAVVSAPSTLVAAVACTSSELEAFTAANATVAPRCVAVLREFGTCADDCLGSFTSAVETAPACTAATSSTGTLVQAASAVVAQCESARATFNTSAAYAPRLAPADAPACTTAQETDWEARYGPEYLFGACSREAFTNRKCTTECRDKIEEGVTNAPACRPQEGESSDLLFSEAIKFHLVRCLSARRERFDTNAVLQAMAAAPVAGSSGSNTDKSPVVATNVTSTKPPSNSVPAGSIVTTAPPVAKPASGAARARAAAALTVLIVMVVTLM